MLSNANVFTLRSNVICQLAIYIYKYLGYTVGVL